MEAQLLAKRGRPHKPYRTSDGQFIDGLSRRPDGRWRIVATGQLFSEPDERLAVARFRALCPHEAVFVPVARSIDPADCAHAADKLAGKTDLVQIEHPNGFAEVGYHIDSKTVWDFLRGQLTENPLHVASMTGIPQLAHFARLDLPKPPVTVTQVMAAYRAHSNGTEKAKKEALKPFKRLVAFAQAKTLDDLTDAKLAAFRHSIVNSSKLKSSGTISAYFARVRSVINRAARSELDPAQISACAARCRAKLYSPENNVDDNPHPISREDFQKLLVNVNKTDTPEVWRAMLLLGLNAALYLEDVCDLQWSHLDLNAKTLLARRKKKGRCLRVAVLWDETVAAIRALPKRGISPFVFVSPRGTRYNKNTKINDFKDYRVKADVSDAVKWSHLRDGAYTAAVTAPGVDEKFARLLAGHKAQGLQDKYVLRNPAMVKPACDAVYAHYMTAIRAAAAINAA